MSTAADHVNVALSIAGIAASSPVNAGAAPSLVPLTAGDSALELQGFAATAVSEIAPSAVTLKLKFVVKLPAPSAVVAPMRVAFAKIWTVTLVSAVPLTVNAAAVAALMQNPAPES